MSRTTKRILMITGIGLVCGMILSIILGSVLEPYFQAASKKLLDTTNHDTVYVKVLDHDK